MSSARLLELMNEGGADGGGACGTATGTEYGKVVDDMGAGVTLCVGGVLFSCGWKERDGSGGGGVG